MKNSKKGVFFTFVAIFLIILVVSMVSTRKTYRYQEKSNAISSRIRTMNTFIDDFEQDLERELLIGGYRSLISLNSYMRDIQGYVDDFDAIFSEIIMYGTANGTQMDLMIQDTQGSDIISWLQRINEEASLLNINVQMDIHNITMIHLDPWIIQLRLNTTVLISDAKGLATWNFTKVYTQDFSILGFEDPLYTVETEDKIITLINRTPNTTYINPINNDTSVLQTHIENSYYDSSTSAPSFLMRFEGNLSNSTHGIESFVYPQELNAQGISIKSRSLIDYIYFGEQLTTDFCNVSEMPSWFRIDNEHELAYGIDNLATSGC